jgi:hypothetical protein
MKALVKYSKKVLYNVFDFLCDVSTKWTEDGIEPTILGWLFHKLKQRCISNNENV